MFVAIGVAILLMYVVLVVQFGSFLEPLSIMLSLPLSLIGVMLALLLANESLNIMSMIGVILLVGIVAKNAIAPIDFAKWSEEAGMDRREALIQAGRVRAATDSDDDVRARGRHGAGGDGNRRRRRLPRTARHHGDRWCRHVDVADAARHPHCVRRLLPTAGIGWGASIPLGHKALQSPGTQVLPGRRRRGTSNWQGSWDVGS